MYLYAIMSYEYADFLRSFFDGYGAEYNDAKCVLVGLTEDQIATYTGEIVRIDGSALNDNQLSALITSISNIPPMDRLVILSIAQGK